MRRVLLFCGGILLGLAAGLILWHGPDLYAYRVSWHSAAFTRIVGVGVIVEGALAALGASVCVGRAIVPLISAPTLSSTARPEPAPTGVGGGPVLPICGILFLLSAVGPFGQVRNDSEQLEVTDSMPGQWGGELVDDFRRQARTERNFGVLWLAVGGALLGTPLFFKPRVWQMGWRMNRVGGGITAGGYLMSSMSAFVVFANGLAMEGASKDLSFAGNAGVLVGAIVAILGCVLAVTGRSSA